MQLKLSDPPGRKTRKVRAYGDEIFRLLGEGYTSEAIREALAEAGLVVSRSTVQREGARVARRRSGAQAGAKAPQPAVSPTGRAAAGTRTGVPMPNATKPSAFAGDKRSGKAIAEEFMASHIFNPLIRERIEHENRGD